MKTLAESLYEEFSEKISNISENDLAGPLPCELGDFWIENFESQLASRLCDLHSRKLKEKGESFYTIGSSGHEIMSFLACALKLTDISLMHYRDAAFFIQKAKKLPGETPLWDLMCSFTASKRDPVSNGRHKVLGSASLFLPPQTSTIASHLPRAVGLALSIPKARELALDSYLTERSVVTCHFGDASLNHASAQTAFNCADYLSYTNIPLPLIFVCEDNDIGISKRTPKGWIEYYAKGKAHIAYYKCSFEDLAQSVNTMTCAVDYCRRYQRPVFLHVETKRLYGHAGNDIENIYRSPHEIETDLKRDPLLFFAGSLLSSKIMTKNRLLELASHYDQLISALAKRTPTLPKIRGYEEVAESIVGQLRASNHFRHPDNETRVYKTSKQGHMAKLLNLEMRNQMAKNQAICLAGLDIGKKGGVYNITKGLHKEFGARRVMDAILDETTILGTGLGLSMNGFLPICEIQFLSYYHNAQDQIRGEAATLSFFSSSQFQNGMVVRAPGLAYQKGFGGHFHNDNSIAVFRDVPGIVIACPSNGHDAALMLRKCVELAKRGRVCVLIEPIALYFTKDLIVENDKRWAEDSPGAEENLELGDFKHVKSLDGKAETLIATYGNGFYMSYQAKEKLKAEHDVLVDLVDLRWLSDYDQTRLVLLAKKYSKILIVDECRGRGSLSEELSALFLENGLINVQRLLSKDCFIPLGGAADLVLLQTQDIIEKILHWKDL